MVLAVKNLGNHAFAVSGFTSSPTLGIIMGREDATLWKNNGKCEKCKPQDDCLAIP